MSIATGQIIENTYRIERLIAAGGMGGVYEATHLQLNSRFALKVMDPAIAQRPDFQARFLREAQAAAGLTHPNIVKVTHVGQWQGLHYLVMELVEHGSLRGRLDRYRQTNTPVSVGFALNLIGQAAEGLDEAHRHGLIHRDIKPENLLLQYTRKPNGSTACTLKIADFGLVQLTQAAGGQQSQIPMLTLDYASPEQLQLLVLDGRSDIFSLGVVAYEMLAGRKPFGEALDWPDATSRRLSITPAPLAALRSDLPPASEAILMRCLSIDPARRPLAAELASALAGPLPVGQNLTFPVAPSPASAGNLTANVPLKGGLTSAPTARATQTPSQWPRVRVREGQNQPRSYDLTTAGLTVGRDSSCAIALADQGVSRQHLALHWDGTQVWVTDAGSSNGSMLGGQRLQPNVATPWPWSMPVRIGSTTLQLSPPTLGPQQAAAPSVAATQRWTQRMQQAQTSGALLALDVGPGEDTLQLTPGQPVTISLLLANLGSQVDHIRLSVEGVPATWLSLPQRPQQLVAFGQPDSDMVLPLTINVPRQPEALAKDYPVKLRAASGVDPKASTAIDLAWTVLPFQAGELTISPRRTRSSNGGRHTLTLRNNGNVPITYALSAEDDELALSYQLSRTRADVVPGDSLTISLTLAPKHAAGAVERTHQFAVSARLNGSMPLVAQGEFVQEAAVQQAPTPLVGPQYTVQPQPAPQPVVIQQRSTGGSGCLWLVLLLLIFGGGGFAWWSTLPFFRQIEIMDQVSSYLPANRDATATAEARTAAALAEADQTRVAITDAERLTAEALTEAEQLTAEAIREANREATTEAEREATAEAERLTAEAIREANREATTEAEREATAEAERLTAEAIREANREATAEAERLTAEAIQEARSRTATALAWHNERIWITNHLLLPAYISFNEVYQGEVAPGETVWFLPQANDVKVSWTVAEVVDGDRLGISIKAQWSSVSPGDTLEIDAQTNESSYFYLIIDNDTDATCDVVVNKGLENEVDQGWQIEPGQQNVGYGYYKFFTNSNVVLDCDDGYIRYYGVFRDRTTQLQYDDSASGRIRLRFSS
jgi:serine/threonine protein kinase